VVYTTVRVCSILVLLETAGLIPTRQVALTENQLHLAVTRPFCSRLYTNLTIDCLTVCRPFWKDPIGCSN